MKKSRGPVMAALAAGAALMVGLGLRAWMGSDAEPTPQAAPKAATAPTGSVGPGPAPVPDRPDPPAPGPVGASAGIPPFSELGLAQRATLRAQATERLRRAEQSLATYEAAARYPHASRPIAEHPDQVRPFAPIVDETLLRMPGGGAAAPGVRLRTSQERVFLAGSESCRVTVALVDTEGRPVPLRITRAVLHEVTPPGRTASTVPVTLDVNDAGRQGDAQAGDGVFTGLIQPAAQGLGGFAGTVRLEMNLESGGQPGFLYFDVVYSPGQAAAWAGAPRETMQDGSLQFQLPIDVRVAGRYVVSGRVDDAQGRPFALALFNDELKAGPGVVPLLVFGRLVRDGRPALPLQLRDVEGFLLREDVQPDRVMLPRLPGVLMRSSVTDPARFSDAAWTSEERSRYLDELGRDVANAREEVNRLGPEP